MLGILNNSRGYISFLFRQKWRSVSAELQTQVPLDLGDNLIICNIFSVMGFRCVFGGKGGLGAKYIPL